MSARSHRVAPEQRSRESSEPIVCSNSDSDDGLGLQSVFNGGDSLCSPEARLDPSRILVPPANLAVSGHGPDVETKAHVKGSHAKAGVTISSSLSTLATAINSDLDTNALSSSQRAQPRIVGRTDHGYTFELFGDFICREARVGDLANVFSHRKRKWSRCRVTRALVADSESRVHGKIGLAILDREQSTFFVRPHLLIPLVPVSPDDRIIVVCRKTSQYRRIVKTQVSPRDDLVVELGSCHAVTTGFMRDCGARRVLGLDSEPQAIAYAREKYPEIEFHTVDALTELEKLGELAQGCCKMFIDIGGNRALKDVECVLDIAQRTVRPPMIVVKSIELFDKLNASTLPCTKLV